MPLPTQTMTLVIIMFLVIAIGVVLLAMNSSAIESGVAGVLGLFNIFGSV